MTPITNGMVQLVAICVMIAMAVAYLIFLGFTWNQLQRYRTAGLARIDAILDKAEKPVDLTKRADESN